MKTYYLTLSQGFPATHARAGQPTGFKENLCKTKMHTIRANYEFWKNRFEQIEKGEACLSIRQWTGKPYRSKQVEIARLTREDGIGIQKLELELADKLFGIYHPRIDDGKGVSSIEELANNDGLSLNDWREWFKDYDLSQPMAIIHFTPFRY